MFLESLFLTAPSGGWMVGLRIGLILNARILAPAFEISSGSFIICTGSHNEMKGGGGILRQPTKVYLFPLLFRD